MHAQPTADPRSLPNQPAPRAAVLYTLVAVLLVLLGASIREHQIHLDEAWIGEQTYFLAHDGYVHSNLFEGFVANDIRVVVYHRLFVLAGSLAVDLFGWSIGSLRVVPLLAGALLLAAMARYLGRDLAWSRERVISALLIFILIPLDFLYVKIYRPEMLMAAFGFLGYWSLERLLERDRAWYAAALGACCAAAALAHPYGAIYAIASFAVLFWKKRWRFAIIAAGTIALVSAPYIYDIATHWNIFIEQISNPLVAEKTHFTLLSPLANLLKEHQRLFRKPEIILITVLFMIALITRWKREFGRRRVFYVFTLLLVVLLGMIGQDKVTRYGIALFPFFAIEVADALWDWRLGRLGGPFWRHTFTVAMALFVAFGLYFAATDAFTNKQYASTLNSEIASHIPRGARVMAPMNFIFNEIPNYTVIGLKMAGMETGNKLAMEHALDFADRHRVDAIVMNRYMTLDEEIEDFEAKRSLLAGRFDTVRCAAGCTILVRAPKPAEPR